MSRSSISALLTAHGSFPSTQVVRENFAALFELAKNDQESAEDLAYGFLEALDQWSHVNAFLPEPIAAALRSWTLSVWNAQSFTLCEQLCAILLNTPSANTKAFLVSERTQTTDPDLCTLLDRYIANHPTSFI